MTVTGDGTLNLVARAGSNVTGTASNSQGVIPRGGVSFWATCDDEEPAGYGTISQGTYEATVPDGQYRVSIYEYRSDDGDGNRTSWHNQKKSCADADVVTVRGDSTIDVRALLGPLVQGSVSTSAGPVQQGDLLFYTDCSDETPDARAWINDGSYEANIPAGSYRVQISAQLPNGDQVRSWHSAKGGCDDSNPVTISGPGTVNLVGLPGRTVSGTVRTDANAVPSHGRLVFYRTCQDYERGDQAGYTWLSNGSFSTVVPAGTYRVQISVEGGAERSWHSASPDCEHSATVNVATDATVALVALSGTQVAGVVRSSRGVVWDGSLSLYPSCAAAAAERDGIWVDLANGGYTTRLAPGTYKVWVNPNAGQGAAASWNGGTGTCADSDTLTVGNSGQTADLVVRAGSNISGYVTTDHGAVADADLSFFLSCEARNESWRGAAYAYSAADGRYVVTLPNGSYKVRIEPWSGGALRSWHSRKHACSEAGTITVNGDTTTQDLLPLGRKVSGTVRSSGGSPISTAYIRFFRTCREYRQGNEAYDAFTMEDGAYETILDEGHYRVLIDDFTQSVWHPSKTSCEDAAVLTVDRDLRVDLQAGSVQSVQVQGSVRRVNGEAVSTGTLTFYTSCTAFANGDPGISTPITAGQYSVSLPRGAYRARIQPGAGTASWHRAQSDCSAAEYLYAYSDTSTELVAVNSPSSPPPPPPYSPPAVVPPAPAPPVPQPTVAMAPGIVTPSVTMPAAKVKKGRALTLAKTTSAGQPITWVALSKKVCKVSGSKVKAKKKGRCIVKASAAATAGAAAYAQTFRIRVT